MPLGSASSASSAKSASSATELPIPVVNALPGCHQLPALPAREGQKQRRAELCAEDGKTEDDVIGHSLLAHPTDIPAIRFPSGLAEPNLRDLNAGRLFALPPFTPSVALTLDLYFRDSPTLFPVNQPFSSVRPTVGSNCSSQSGGDVNSDSESN